MRAFAYLSLVLVTSCTVPDKFFQDAGGGDDVTPDADVSGPDAEPDNTAPETTITSMPGDFDNDGTPSFEFSSDEAGTFLCSFDGETATACTSPATRTLADGPHTFSVTAVDLAGNQDESPASHAWTIDTVAPETTIDSGPPANDNSTTVTFTFSADETNVTFECQLDTAAYAACTSPHMPAGLANGAHTFRVRATDRAGNTDASPDTHPWTIDTSTPDTTIDSGPTGPTQGTGATFTFSSNAGAGATYECRRTPPGGAFAACTSPVVYSGLTEGQAYTFEVRVRNAALTYDPTPATRTWTVDNTAPNTSFTSGVPGSFLASTSVNIAFTCSEPTGATYQCNVDGTGFAACTSPHQASGLSQGSHSLAVRCSDAAGNQDASAVSASWTVDTVAPTTTIMSAPPDNSTSTTANFDFASNETVTYQCKVDSPTYGACADPYATTVGQGGHTLDVFAVDQAGNQDLSPAQDTWTVDSIDPIVTFMTPTPAAGGSVGPYNTYAWTVNRTATTTCSINGGTAFACTSPYTTHTKAGATTFAVTATDTFGNDATYTRSFTIACSAPTADATTWGLLHMDEGGTTQTLTLLGTAGGSALRGLDNVVETVDPQYLGAGNGRFSNGLAFTQSESDTVRWTMGTVAAFRTRDHTIEMWVRPTDLSGSSYQDLFTSQDGRVRVLLDPIGGGNYAATYSIIDDAGVPSTIAAPTPISVNVWHHIVATFSNTAMAIYQDADVKTGTSGAVSTNGFLFGVTRLGNSAKPYPGAMDEVWLNTTPLTNAQVMPRYCPPP